MMRHIQRRIGPSLSSLPSNRTLCARLHVVFIVPSQQPVLYTRSFSSRHNGFRPSIGPSVSIPALIATDCRATPSPVSKPGCLGSGDRKRNYAQEALRGQEEENQSEPTPVRTFERYLPKIYAPRIPITESRTVNESEIAELQRSKGKVPEAEGKESREDGAVDKKARWKTSGQSARKPPAKQGTAKDARLQITKPSFPSRKNIPENVKSNINGSSVHLQDSIIFKTDNRSVSGEGILPDAVDHDDSTEVEILPFHSLGKEQLSQGPALTLSASEDAYLDATSDFNFADDFVEIDQEDLMRHLQGVEEYAPAQNEAIKQGIKDVGGRPAWGTKGNPLKGDLDPLEVDMMGIDKLAGGEEQSSFFMDIELEEARYAVREGSERIPGIKQPPHDLAEMNDDVDSLRTPPKKTRFRSRPAKAEGGQVPQKELSISQTRLQAVKSMLRSISAEEDDARYGMDGDGNPSYSRFQWWRRATSRHAASFYDAKKVTVQRKALPIHKLSSKDYWYKPLERYTENFIPLIEAEQAHEEKVIRERLDTMAVEKLATEGYCLTDLSARPDKASQAGRPTYTFAFAGRGGSPRFAWNRFNPGTSVIISPAGEKVKPVKRDQSKGGKGSTAYNTGSVVSKTFGSVKVSFDEPLNEAELSNTWRLDIWTSDIVLRRAKEALSTLHYNPVAIDRHGVPQPEVVSTTETGEVTELVKPSIPITQQILPGTALRRVLLDDFIPHDATFSRPAHLNGPGFFADNELIQSWCRRQLVDRREPIEVEGDPDIALNTSQKRAIATMLSSNISLIQGPPGTGKTRTIIEMLRLLKVHWEVPQAILVSAYTNAACDNLAEGMSKRGLKVLRYGSKSRIREDLHELTLDQHLDRHPDKNRLHWLKDQTFKLSKDDPSREGLRRQLFGLERRMMHDILLSVDVVCATCISSRGRLLDVVDFPVVFIDEASMATEPNAVIPLTKGCQHAALIGDHKQLPPLVMSAKAEEGKLGTSLFERLIKGGKVPSVMLDTQYRMHPSISAFPSKAFYGSKLKDGTIDNEGNILAGLEPPQGVLMKDDVTGRQRTVTFLHHTNPETARAKSIMNEGEAEIIYAVVLKLLKENPNLVGSDIGIIAPYAGQISRIQNEIRHDLRRRRQSVEYLGEERAWEIDNIEVHTVDGFEGREKRVILFSTTRSNEGNWIGFLRDWRRMNVGLTRAKSGLIIVGNSHTLGNAQSHLTNDSEDELGARHWRNLIRDLRDSNAIEAFDIDGADQTNPEQDPEDDMKIIHEQDVAEHLAGANKSMW